MPSLIRPVQDRISQVFGANKAYYSKFGLAGHEGIDYASPVGTSIKAAASGVVTYAGWHTNYGNYMKISHSDGTSTGYAHLSYFAVRSGHIVKQGDVIGKTGNTGNSTGAHLHFMLLTKDIRNGYGGAINPQPYITNQGASPQEETVKIGGGENWYNRLNKLHLQVRGRPLERSIFDKFVGADTLSFIEAVSDNKEADTVQTWQTVGKTAVTDKWDQQIYKLQDQVKALSTRPTTAELDKLQANADKLAAQVTELENQKSEDSKTLDEAGGLARSVADFFSKLIKRGK